MKVKFFSGQSEDSLEKRINHWLETHGNIYIKFIKQSVDVSREKPTSNGVVWISIWYNEV